MCDDNDDDENCCQYLHKILDIAHAQSPILQRRGRAERVGTQALPTPMDEYMGNSGESGWRRNTQ